MWRVSKLTVIIISSVYKAFILTCILIAWSWKLQFPFHDYQLFVDNTQSIENNHSKLNAVKTVKILSLYWFFCSFATEVDFSIFNYTFRNMLTSFRPNVHGKSVIRYPWRHGTWKNYGHVVSRSSRCHLYVLAKLYLCRNQIFSQSQKN